MSRLVDADELKLELKWLEIDKPVYHDVMSTIDKMATVDAVEVIRCGDCRYYDAENHNCLDELGYARVWEEDDYCSFAERRKNDKRDNS